MYEPVVNSVSFFNRKHFFNYEESFTLEKCI